MTSLLGKVAIVTGAARGIGRASCVALASAGADVVGIDICASVNDAFGTKPATIEDLMQTQELVQKTGRQWLSIILDQRSLPALQKAAFEVEQKFGGVDILFANAGVQGFVPLLEMDDAHWHTHMDVNLTGTANAIRAFAPQLVKRGSGRIIITSSTQGRHGTKNGAAYSASKWGLIGLMKSASLELGKYGITVNCLIPGLINTPLTRHEERYAQVLQEVGMQPTGLDEDEAIKILIHKTPLGVPWLQPENVANMVVFLASDAAKMISGSTFDVTAGDSAHNAI